MKKIALPLISLLTSAPVLASSHLDFHGYVRAGMSTTSDGGEQTCFGSGAQGHYAGRLGDECETYGEFAVSNTLSTTQGQSFYFDTMVSTETAQGAQLNDYQSVTEPGSANSAADWALRQLNVQAKGLLSSDAQAVLWAGKRYYQRRQVNILDLFYLNNSGYGAGIENFSAGPGALSLAIINADQDSFSGKSNSEGQRKTQINKFDVRYALPFNQHTLETAFIYAWSDPTKVQDNAGEPADNGYFISAELISQFGPVENHAVIQYSSDAMGDAAWKNASGSKVNTYATWEGQLDNTVRFIDYGFAHLSSKVDLAYSLVYSRAETLADADVAESQPQRTSLVLRPSYHWSDTMRTSLELGFDEVKEATDPQSRDLQKLVVAQEFSLPGDAVLRPSLRFYAGLFSGEQAEQQRTANGDGESENIRVGAQLEMWW